jgi:ubiquinone/menaquinone biosynthesis C-methylase UbiE
MSAAVWSDPLHTITRLFEGVFGHAPYPHELSFLIDNPLRRLLITPEQIAERLDVKADSRVLEVGPGSGYFSVELARRAHRGRLDLFDLQPEMLAKARAKLVAAGMKRVGFSAGDAAAMPYRRGSFDRVLVATVLGEVPRREDCLRSVHDVLVPGGLVAVHEQLPDPDLISPEELGRLLMAAGFEGVARTGPWWNYTAVFRKPG